jgi:hypothetical protein
MTDTSVPRGGLPGGSGASPARRHRRSRCGRPLAALAVAIGSLGALAAPASAGVAQVRGDAFYDEDGSVCGTTPPAGYGEFTSLPPLAMSGDLDGCLWTLAGPSRTTPSGVFLETGQEVFVGTLADGDIGTFATTYRFESKWDSAGQEIHGRCQHPIVDGSGTGGLEGVTGRLFFKDAPPNYPYRGHLTFD